MREVATVRVRSRQPAVEADLLEIDGPNPPGGLVHLLQPGSEAKVDHAAAFEPTSASAISIRAFTSNRARATSQPSSSTTGWFLPSMTNW